MEVTITLGTNAEKRILGIPEEEVSVVLTELLEKALDDSHNITNPVVSDNSLPVQPSNLQLGNNEDILAKLNFIAGLINGNNTISSGESSLVSNSNIVTQQKVLDVPFGKHNAEIVTSSISNADEIDIDSLDLMVLLK